MFARIKNPALRRFMKFWASLKLAVLVILGVAILSAYGTIVESQYDATTAQKLVYHSWWSYGIFALLAVNLIAVMMDRWPWRKHHMPFLLAHIGIIILLAGSLITKYFGIDGSMRVGVGETTENILLTDTDLIVWASLDGSTYKNLSEEPYTVDFLVNRPSREKPVILPAGGHDLKVVDFIPYALRDSQVEESEDPKSGPGVRFQLHNDRVNLNDWIVLSSSQKEEAINLGPAQVVFSTHKDTAISGNQIVLRPEGSKLHYTIRKEADLKNQKVGVIEPGEAVETGWMGLKLRILKYLPRAQNLIKFIAVKRPGKNTTSAIVIEFNGQEHQLGLNSILRLFTDEGVYLVSYGNKQIPIGFPIHLKEFEVGRYQGTMRAASYESLVEVPSEAGAKEAVKISMNEPMKKNGFTVYQSSFEQDASNKPVASIFSINKDPGRPWKYLGSFLIVFGTIQLFYFKHRQTKGKAKT